MNGQIGVYVHEVQINESLRLWCLGENYVSSCACAYERESHLKSKALNCEPHHIMRPQLHQAVIVNRIGCN